MQKWYDLAYLATDDAEWRTTLDLVVGASKSTRQCKKEEAKLKML